MWAVADPGEDDGAMHPQPIKISYKKDGCQRQQHRFCASHPPYLAAGSATAGQVLIQGSLTQLFFMHQLTFGLRGTERI